MDPITGNVRKWNEHKCPILQSRVRKNQLIRGADTLLRRWQVTPISKQLNIWDNFSTHRKKIQIQCSHSPALRSGAMELSFDFVKAT